MWNARWKRFRISSRKSKFIMFYCSFLQTVNFSGLVVKKRAKIWKIRATPIRWWIHRLPTIVCWKARCESALCRKDCYYAAIRACNWLFCVRRSRLKRFWVKWPICFRSIWRYEFKIIFISIMKSRFVSGYHQRRIRRGERRFGSGDKCHFVDWENSRGGIVDVGLHARSGGRRYVWRFPFITCISHLLAVFAIWIRIPPARIERSLKVRFFWVFWNFVERAVQIYQISKFLEKSIGRTFSVLLEEFSLVLFSFLIW